MEYHFLVWCSAAKACGRLARAAIGAAVVACMFLSAPVSARQTQPDPREKHVLLIHSYSLRVRYTRSQDTEIREGLARIHPGRVTISTIELDYNANEDEDVWDDLRAFIKRRYERRPLDLVIATDTHAMRFLERYARDMLPPAPIVLSAVKESPSQALRDYTQVTGIAESIDVYGTIELMRRLHPGTRRLIVINTRSVHGRELKEKTVAALASMDGDIEVEWLEGLPLEQTIEKLRDAPQDAGVLFLSYWDPSGRRQTLDQTLGAMSLASKHPIYALYDSFLGYGAIGGCMASAENYGRTAASMAGRILQGEPVSSVKMIGSSANPPMFDARELRRRGISPASLPPGSHVVNSEVTFLDRNAGLIGAGAAVVLVEAVIIGWLIVSRRRSVRAEAALRSSEERYRLASLAGDDVVRDWNVETGRISWNEAMSHVLGFPDSLRETDLSWWSDRIHPMDRVRVLAGMAPEKGQPGMVTWSAEYRFRRADERYVDVVDRGCVVRDDRGIAVRAVGAITDVSARREAERALRESEERFRRVIEALPVGVCVHDGSRFLFVNATLTSLLGAADAESLLKMPVETVLQPEGAAACAERFRLVMAGNSAPANEMTLLALSGARIEVEIRCTPVVYAGRRVVQTTVVDLTERKAAEFALHESEERVRQITENADEVFWLAEAGARGLTYVSPAFEAVWGFPASSLRESVEPLYDSIHPEDRARVERTSRRGDVSFDQEYRIIRPDGEVRWIRERAYPVHNSAGKVVRIAGIADDITESKRARDILRRNYEVQQLLLSELDHRVKNSLSGLLTLIDMMVSNSPEVAPFGGSIRSRVSAMLSVHAMLSDSHWMPVGIRRLLQGVLPPHVPGRVASHGPDVRIPARQVTAMGMIFQELVTNALKYGALSTPEGTVDVRWWCEPATEPGLETLRLTWTERAGPRIDRSVKTGLGSRLIEGFARFEMCGKADLTFDTAGASHSFTLTLDHSPVTDRPMPAEAPSPAASPVPLTMA